MDPNIFHGYDDKLPMSKAEIKVAKSICYLCPVQASCLQDALSRRDFWGVYGGLTGPERYRLMEGKK